MARKTIMQIHIIRAGILAVMLVCVMLAAGSDPVFAGDAAGPSGTLPVISFRFEDPSMVDEMNNSFDHSFRATGVTMDITVPENYSNPDCKYIEGLKDDASAEVSDLPLEYIRGRGNTTWQRDKKPYKFKLDKKAGLFGMGVSKHWVLLANDSDFDHAQVKDRLVSWLGQRLGLEFTPKCVPVEVVMNGDYYGTYLLSEQVRLGDNSLVNLPELGEKDTDAVSITGGYLIGFGYDDYKENYFMTEHGLDLTSESPAYEPEGEESEGDPDAEMHELPPGLSAQLKYISGFVQDVEDAIYADGHVNGKGQKLADLMDMDSAVDYWWIQEFTMNPDAFNTPSTYMYKKRDTVDGSGKVTPGKLYWGPLWDFDQSLADDDLEPDGSFDDLPYIGFSHRKMIWFEYLRQDPEFAGMLKDRWRDIDAELETMLKKGGLLDQYAEEMGAAWAADYKRWDRSEYYSKPDTCAGAIKWLKQRISTRRAWVNSNIDIVGDVFCDVIFSAEGEDDIVETVYNGMTYDASPPEAPEKEGLIFVGWFTKDGKEFDYTDIATDGLHYYAKYVTYDKATKATDIFIYGPPEICVPANSFINLKYEVFPEDAQDKRITWTSSDGNVVIADNDNFEIKGTGHTVITGTLASGASASIDVYVTDPDDPDAPGLPDRIIFDNRLEVKKGGFACIGIRTEPSPCIFPEKQYMFNVEDPDIADVDIYGVVHGIRPGKTKVTIVESTDLEYIPAGECLITVTGGKAANTLRVKAKKAVTLKYSSLRKAARVIKRSRAMKVSGAKGTVRYKIVSVSRVKKGKSVKSKAARKKFSVNAKNGKITVKKGLKKGIYRIKVRVTAAGNKDYSKKSKDVVVKVKVK